MNPGYAADSGLCCRSADERDSKNFENGGEQRLGAARRWECTRPMANRELASSGYCATQCLLRLTRTPGHGRSVLAYPAEAPYADPHDVRWLRQGRRRDSSSYAACHGHASPLAGVLQFNLRPGPIACLGGADCNPLWYYFASSAYVVRSRGRSWVRPRLSCCAWLSASMATRRKP